MRYLIAIEGHRESPPYFLDIDEEMLEGHPDLTFKVGEIIGLYMKYGGEIGDGS